VQLGETLTDQRRFNQTHSLDDQTMGAKRQFDNKEEIVLPENLFINSLDTELQERILNRKKIDLDVKDAMETLLEEGPTDL
jgi:hypothetical protein